MLQLGQCAGHEAPCAIGAGQKRDFHTDLLADVLCQRRIDGKPITTRPISSGASTGDVNTWCTPFCVTTNWAPSASEP